MTFEINTEFELDEKGVEKFKKAIEIAMTDSVQGLADDIRKITPRDKKRLPDNPKRKVTGSLKRSIGYEQDDRFEYRIGTEQNEAEYGKFLEFWTPFMIPRSFLRLGLEMFWAKFLDNLVKRSAQILASKK